LLRLPQGTSRQSVKHFLLPLIITQAIILQKTDRQTDRHRPCRREFIRPNCSVSEIRGLFNKLEKKENLKKTDE